MESDVSRCCQRRWRGLWSSFVRFEGGESELSPFKIFSKQYKRRRNIQIVTWETFLCTQEKIIRKVSRNLDGKMLKRFHFYFNFFLISILATSERDRTHRVRNYSKRENKWSNQLSQTNKRILKIFAGKRYFFVHCPHVKFYSGRLVRGQSQGQCFTFFLGGEV